MGEGRLATLAIIVWGLTPPEDLTARVADCIRGAGPAVDRPRVRYSEDGWTETGRGLFKKAVNPVV